MGRLVEGTELEVDGLMVLAGTFSILVTGVWWRGLRTVVGVIKFGCSVGVTHVCEVARIEGQSRLLCVKI